MSIGEKIKFYRKEKNLTQKELGKLCGMNESQIRKYESDSINPKLETLTRISYALDVGINDLVMLDINFVDLKQSHKDMLNRVSAYYHLLQDPYDKDDKIKKLLTLFSALNNEGKEKAIDQLILLSKIPEYKK